MDPKTRAEFRLVVSLRTLVALSRITWRSDLTYSSLNVRHHPPLVSQDAADWPLPPASLATSPAKLVAAPSKQATRSSTLPPEDSSSSSTLMMSKKNSGKLVPSGHTSPAVSKCFLAYSMGPDHTVLPPVSSTTSSKSAKMEPLGWWMVQIIVLPALARDARTLITFSAWKESSPVVGSSQKIGALESTRSSSPMLRRFFSPPEIPLVFLSPTMVSAQPVRLRDLRTSCTRLSFSSSEASSPSLNCAACRRVSLTVIMPKKMSS
mmetsp:Transcript_223/g.727  ORF Transcript_223/g.727 Transcript_223/m.727 type:complete len:264 (-) Transcript_223:466-1257(-)